MNKTKMYYRFNSCHYYVMAILLIRKKIVIINHNFIIKSVKLLIKNSNKILNTTLNLWNISLR